MVREEKITQASATGIHLAAAARIGTLRRVVTSFMIGSLFW